jgi:signal transduction histidine kinase
MRQGIAGWMKKSLTPGYRYFGTASPLYDLRSQVNLIAMSIIGFLVVGLLTHFIQQFSSTSFALTVAAIPAFCIVILLNTYKYFDIANVLFYIFLNAVSVICSREMSTPITTTVLGYFLDLCLIVFLFQNAFLRIACVLIVILRFLLLESSVGLISNSLETTSRYVVDGMELLLILLVLSMYAFQMKAVEDAQVQNELFSQHMSHDLKIGFRALSTMIENAKRLSSARGDSKIGEREIDELANGSRFYGYILKNFLEFAKMKSRSMKTNQFLEIDLEEELNAIVGLHQYIAAEKNITIHLHVDDRMPTLIVSDKVKIRRIVLNLLTNAIDNSPAAKEILVTVNWNGDSWQLTITNEGKGLKDEEIRQIFLPYAKKGNLALEEKLGFGLPIAKVLTESLGGQIMASSVINKETLFTVAFPI